MSISLVEKEIARFLESPAPEVICIRGKWGVGKTYFWNEFVRMAKERDAIALKSYAYVSLFGIDSLERLKYSIFENRVGKENIGIEPSVKTFKSNASAVIKQLGLKSLGIISSLPHAKNYASAFQSLSFLSLKETIICIDDLERKGDELPMKDVMGLISLLRDRKECKIAVILNDGELKNENKEEFSRYHEKVIDASLLFDPDPKDCVRIAVKSTDQTADRLRAAVTTLGISNIRIIKKIERLVVRVAPILKDFHPNVLNQAVQSLTLLGWSAHSDDAAPPLDYLLHRRGKNYYGLQDDEKMPDDERAWNSLLDDFDFTMADEFDIELLRGIKHGYFDEAALLNQASELNKRLEAEEGEGSLRAAWDLYHDGFEDNEAELVAAICSAYRQNVELVTPTNLDAAINLLNDLGRSDEAIDTLNFYVEHRGENRDLFDLSSNFFGDDVTNPDVRAAFDRQYESFKDDRSPAEVLVQIATNHAWGRRDITLLLKLSADDYFTMFKELRGSNLSKAIKTGLQFGKFNDADQDMKDISAKVEEALARIGRESQVNRRRVQKKYGVEVDE